MTDLLNQLVSFIGDNPGFAGAIVFLIAMGEALFIVGLFVPSTVVLVGAGTLVGLGKLEAWPIFLWTTLGAIAGDAVSYWIGHVYKDRLKSVWPLSRYRSLVERGEAFFLRHGGKSVFIGRFVPGVKAVVPGIAGMVGMNATRFTIINVVSAVAWAIAHLGPGFLAGTAFSALGEVSGRLALVLGVLCVIVFVAVMLGRWLILIVLPLFPGTHVALVAWCARRPDRLSRWVARTFDPEHPRSAGMLVSALLLLVTMPAFFWVVAEIAPGEAMLQADVAIRNLFQSLRTPLGDHIMVFITMLGDGVVVTVVTLAAAGYLFLRRAWRRALGFLVAMTGAALFVPLLKLTVLRLRPLELYDGAHAYSFPSGHATLNAVLYGILTVLVAHDRSPWTKAALFTVTAAYVLALGFSRVYLGAHWASDVVAGLLFGVAMVSAFGFVFGSIHNEKVGRTVLAVLVAAVLAAAGGWHVHRAFDAAVASYEPVLVDEVLAADAWLAGRWAELPARRIGLSGEDREPLVIQHAGLPARFAEVLAEHGWRRPPRWSIASAAGFVAGRTAAEDLPVLPRTQNGRRPALILIRDDPPDAPDAGRWILRLWPAGVALDAGGRRIPLYVGGVLHEKILHPMGEFSGPATDREAPAPDDNPALLMPGAIERLRPDGGPVVLVPPPA
ncbi:bifunctional DedA family/phosphatase PAP2 family protein [Polymorphum gilvum]|uniref:Phosphoesterase, PA-phosphatase related protein n=1 Tax=Polymorphum gilvum (strain LMG 25793 / CGMCC 1.9160 / SL003B-26A1) TaxID=991905 RepID=F2IVG3_POLGS|nr:bifunctional DedA family/phosphatase PAP2 family protein [Polymorphum gilvum]ADZ72681.1 Phosphoesterase, PA-phosphatase related protein [Polymorphum gilvum SL003B-26A1]